ncbi:MAG: ComF family protein [Pikeienuella sp.]|uniref:ComF family protein n=1 Tax=Pikeienuella sp. TaxID=2831957 RepID=UPI00391D8BCD
MIEKLHDPASGDDAAGYTRPARRRNPGGWVARAAETIARLVYPPACPACRAEIAEPGGLCPACWRDTIFINPPACNCCGAPMAFGPSEGLVCDACEHAPPAWARGVGAVVYEGAARRLILALKHGDRLDVAPLAARWMLAAQGGAGGTLVKTADLIAPAPLHWKRMLKRKYNQSGEIARELARISGKDAALALDLLERTRSTQSQEGRNRRERRENVAGAFAVARRWRSRIAGRRVLLIDDVLTTGATLSGCAEACRAAGAADVNVLTFARVAREERPA